MINGFYTAPVQTAARARTKSHLNAIAKFFPPTFLLTFRAKRPLNSSLWPILILFPLLILSYLVRFAC